MKKLILILGVVLNSCTLLEIPKTHTVDIRKEKSIPNNCEDTAFFVKTSSAGNLSDLVKPFPFLYQADKVFFISEDTLMCLNLNNLEYVSKITLDPQARVRYSSDFAKVGNDKWWNVRRDIIVGREHIFKLELLDTNGQRGERFQTLSYANNSYPPAQIATTSDNGCIVTLHSSWELADAPIKFTVYRFDSLLHLLWSKVIVSKLEIEKIIQTNTGEFLLCGYTHEQSNVISPEGYVTKLDKDGNVMWSKKMGNKVVFDMAILSENRYAFLKEETWGPKSQSYLEVTDSNGVEKWTSTVMNNPKFLYTTTGKIIVGYQANFADTGFDIVLKCMDIDGNLEWHQRFGGTGDEELIDIIEVPYVGYYFLGLTKEYTGDGYKKFCCYDDSYEWINFYDQKNYIIKTDLQGNSCK